MLAVDFVEGMYNLAPYQETEYHIGCMGRNSTLQNPTATVDRLLLRGREVTQVLGVSRALAYRWMADGTLPVVRVSRAVRVPQEALRRWIEQQTKGGNNSESA